MFSNNTHWSAGTFEYTTSEARNEYAKRGRKRRKAEADAETARRSQPLPEMTAVGKTRNPLGATTD